MKNNLLLLILLLTVNLSSFGQNLSWIFGQNYTKNINAQFPQPLPIPGPINSNPYDGYDGNAAQRAQNIITDANQQIRFFIVDGFIYDRNGFLIDEMTATPSNIPVYGYMGQTGAIPIPGSCDEYLIVSTSRFDENINVPAGSTSYIGKLKVQYLDNGLIDPCSGFIPSVDPMNGDESFMTDLADLAGSEYYVNPGVAVHDEHHKFAVTEENNGFRFLLVANEDYLFKFKIANSGVTYEGKIHLIPIDPSINLNDDLRAEMEVMTYNGNFRLAIPITSIPGFGIFNGVFVMDLDLNGNFIPSSNKLIKYNYSTSSDPIVDIKGIEFSQNGERLYLTHSLNNSLYQSSIDRFDLTSANPTLTRQVVSNSPLYKDSHIERISGDRIIIPTQTNMAYISLSSGAVVPSIGSLFLLSNYNAVSPFSSIYSTPRDYARLLQNQIDDMDYVAYLSEGIQCCLDNRVYDKNIFTATTNGFWSAGGNPLNSSSGANVYIKTELRIPAGVTVTIQGMNLFFAPGARLVIENSSTIGGQGGKLILDGTTLSVDINCDPNAMWLGVEVWGNQTLTQGTFNNSNQGRLELKNNSIIEHARIGALASKRNSGNLEVCQGVFESYVIPESFDNSRNGGIIISKNSFFLDNQTGVYIPKYYSPANSNHLAQFKNTVFEWNGLLKDPSLAIQHHARLTENNGVSFYGCDFLNSAPGVFDELNGQGIGIQASNATFYVNSYCNAITPIGVPCPSADRSTFQNLSIGILSFYFTTPKAFNCENSTFTDCRYGIYTNNSRQIKVTQNLFEVRENTYQTAGLTIFNSTGYKVEGNNLYEFDDLSITNGTGNSYGIVVNNSGTLHNEIYRNRFWNLKIGGQSEKQNATQTTSQVPNSVELFNMRGLVWQCNYFDNIYETDLNLVSGSIDYFQGNSILALNSSPLAAKRKAANNRFSLPYEDPNGGSFIPAHDLKSSDDSQQYQYTWIVGGHMYPDNISTNLLIQRDEIDFFPMITDTTGACPNKLIGKQKVQIKSERADIKEQIAQLQAYIDKGDKVGLLSYIATWNDKHAVKNELISASPYLSDEVLTAYINSNPPSAMLKDVMISNSPLSIEVKDLLATKNLPIGTKNQINAAQTGTSQRFILYSEINYLDGVFNDLYYDLLRHDLFDTVNVNTIDSLIVTLEEEGTRDAKEMLLETYILKGDNAQADAIRSELVTLNSPVDFIDLADVIKEIRPLQATSWAFDNNPSLKVQVENIRDNSVHPALAVKAKIMLETNENLENVPDFLMGNSNHSMQQTIQENNSNDAIVPLFVSIYPNPSTGLVYFDYPELGEGIISLQLFDVNGKEMYSHNSASESNGERVDLSHIKKGMYLVRVSIDGEYIETQKLFLK